MIGLILDHNGVVCLGNDFYKERSSRIAKIFGIEWNEDLMHFWKKLYVDASLGKLSLKEYYDELRSALNVSLKGDEDDLFVGMEEIIPEIADVLRIVRRNHNVKLILLSNYVEEWVLKFLDKHDIRKYFHTVVVSSTIKVRKPNPDSFIITAKKAGVDIKDCIYVGDSVCDLEVCKKLGMRPVFIPGEETDGNGFETISSVRDIANLC